MMVMMMVMAMITGIESVQLSSRVASYNESSSSSRGSANWIISKRSALELFISTTTFAFTFTLWWWWWWSSPKCAPWLHFLSKPSSGLFKSISLQPCCCCCFHSWQALNKWQVIYFLLPFIRYLFIYYCAAGLEEPAKVLVVVIANRGRYTLSFCATKSSEKKPLKASAHYYTLACAQLGEAILPDQTKFCLKLQAKLCWCKWSD